MPENLHPNLPQLPLRIKKLPVDARGFPVPWFVEWFHADGVPFESVNLPIRAGDYPDFRVMDSRKLVLAVKEKRCWVCGDPLGKYFAFVLGPMCAINRISSEPPSHRDCAEFSGRACPFLTKPKVERREENMPEGTRGAAGVMLTRNPGVALVWVTDSYDLYRTREQRIGGEVKAHSGVLFEIGPAIECLWFAEGRKATRAEVMASIRSGLPVLRETCKYEDNPEDALRAIDEKYTEALLLVPA